MQASLWAERPRARPWASTQHLYCWVGLWPQNSCSGKRLLRRRAIRKLNSKLYRSVFFLTRISTNFPLIFAARKINHVLLYSCQKVLVYSCPESTHVLLSKVLLSKIEEDDGEDHEEGDDAEDDLQPLLELTTEGDGTEAALPEQGGVVLMVMMVVVRHCPLLQDRV